MKDCVWDGAGTGDTTKYKQITWEALKPTKCLDEWIRRIKVPNGWLVALKDNLVYIPDSDHSWLK